MIAAQRPGIRKNSVVADGPVAFTDDFNRAAGALGGTATSSNPDRVWEDITGGGLGSALWALSGTAAVPARSTDNAAVIDCLSADGLVEVTVITSGTPPDYIGLLLRLVDANNWWLLYSEGANYFIVKCVAGIQTGMGSVVDTFSSGDVISASAVGNVLSIYRNGVLRHTVTDAAHNTATKHGIWSYAPGVTPIVPIDDFAYTP